MAFGKSRDEAKEEALKSAHWGALIRRQVHGRVHGLTALPTEPSLVMHVAEAPMPVPVREAVAIACKLTADQVWRTVKVTVPRANEFLVNPEILPCNFLAGPLTGCQRRVSRAIHVRSARTLDWRRFAFCEEHGGRMREEMELAKFLEEYGVVEVIYE